MKTLPLAPLGRRLGSLLYEALVIIALAIFLFILPVTVLAGISQHVPAPGWLWLYMFCLLGSYFIGCWLRGAQTLAMKTWRLKVVDAESGRPLRPLQAFVRYGMGWIFWPTGIALLWVALDPDQQFLHDRIAGSRIVSAS